MNERKVHWRLLLRTKSEAKALLMEGKVRETLGTEIVSTVSPKDDTLYEVAFDAPLHARDPQAALYETLLFANRIAVDWTVNGPRESANGTVEFEGSADERRHTIRVPGVAIANFTLIWRP